MRIAVLILLAIAAPAAAQDGVFDMGQLTGALSVDHITQSERARAARMRGRSGYSPAKARSCRNVPRFRAQLGASNPKVRRLTQLCRQQGYRIR